MSEDGESNRLPPGLVDAVKARARVADVVGRRVPLNRRGQARCPFHDERTPSFHIHRNRYKCFGCGAGGGAIDFVMAFDGVDFATAVRSLAGDLGIGSFTPARPAAPPTQAARCDGGLVARRAQEDIRAVASAIATLKATETAPGTIVESYLRGRGIRFALGFPPALRLVRGERHVESGRVFDCMVAPARRGDGRVTACHLTFLAPRRLPPANPNGAGAIDIAKAPVSPAKKMRGRPRGACIRLAPEAAHMGLAEGIETALSVMDLHGVPCWAAMSLDNLITAEFPPTVRAVTIFADADNKDNAMAAERIRRALMAHEAAGRRASVAWAPEGADWNDAARGSAA